MRPSPLLAASLLSMSGAIEPYRKPDGAVGYRTRPLPDGAEGAVAEAKVRREALHVLLAPAPFGMVRTWCATLAAAMETRDSADGTWVTVDAMASLLEPMPALCFSRESIRMVAHACAENGGWLPSYARVYPILSGIAAPLRDEAERLDKLIALLEAGPPGNLLAAPKPGGGEVLADAEVDAWIASVAGTPPSLPRMVRCRAFLKTLAQRRPDLSPDRIARIEALR
jgi:hypothetical protein